MMSYQRNTLYTTNVKKTQSICKSNDEEIKILRNSENTLPDVMILLTSTTGKLFPQIHVKPGSPNEVC